jgi:hypothetical protein
MKAHNPEACVYEPVDPSWWPRLNKQIGELSGLPEETPKVLADWIARQKFRSKPTFGLVVANMKQWSQRALADRDKVTAAPTSGVRFARFEQEE